MRVALVWNAPTRLVDITTRYEPYVEGFHCHGVDTVTVCPAGTEGEYPYPVRCFAGEHELACPAFWKQCGCDAVVIITWHRMTRILQAIRASGMPVVAMGESDAQMSPRFHPWPTFRFMTYLQLTRRGKLGAAKQWLRRFLFRAVAEHQALIENTAAANILGLGGEGVVEEFRRLIRRIGAPELAARIAWIPYPVPEMFCHGPVNRERPARIIAVGRWGSSQKAPELLSATIRRLHAIDDRTEVLIAGKESIARFAHLARTNRPVHLVGVQPRDRIRDLMAGCRAVLVPSRWEGAPLVANEMLALGGTVVGTPIPSIRGIVADGRFGRMSSVHTAASLADAIQKEISAWDCGERDPIAIAAHWRRLVSPAAVAERILALLGMSPQVAGFARMESIQ